jgi:tRNA threonylcarbamoyladenosine biosynthesis protein TsaE
MQKILQLKDEAASLEFAEQFAKLCKPGCIIYLQGELGAGKTTFVRGFLHGLGYTDKVKSPTFTIVESYEFEPSHRIFHFDLYRLVDPEELDLIGIREYFAANAICLIEWPERALSVLKPADVQLQWAVVDEGRQVVIESLSAKGEEILRKM